MTEGQGSSTLVPKKGFNWDEFLKNNKITKIDKEYVLNKLNENNELNLMALNEQRLNVFCNDVLKLDFLSKKRFIKGILSLNANNSAPSSTTNGGNTTIKAKQVIISQKEKQASQRLDDEYKQANELINNIINGLDSMTDILNDVIQNIDDEMNGVITKVKQKQARLMNEDIGRIVKTKENILKVQLNGIKSKRMSSVCVLKTAPQVKFKVKDGSVEQFFKDGLFVNTFDSPYTVDIKIKSINSESMNIKMGVKKIKNDPKSVVIYYQVNIAQYNIDHIELKENKENKSESSSDSNSDSESDNESHHSKKKQKTKKVTELYKMIKENYINKSLLKNWKTFESESNKYCIEGLKKESYYILKVRGYNEYGFGNYSSLYLIQTRSDRFFKYKKDFDKHGIIYYLGTKKGTKKKWNNPAIKGKILSIESTPMFQNTYFNYRFISHIPDFTDNYTKGGKPGDYFIVNFKKRYIKPTRYTLRHDKNASNYLRHWEFLGYNKTKQKWKIIKKHVNDLGIMNANGTHTWKVKGKDYYNKFKISMTGQCSSNAWYILCNGFEIYGYLQE